MRRPMTRKLSMRTLVSLIVAITAALGLVSAVLNATSTVSFLSPTATHTGYFAVSYTGVYHYVTAEPVCSMIFPPCWTPSEVVFYLTTENETAVRLVFYCGPDYCYNPQQISFHDGDRIYVKGTLIRPSDWPTSKYQPVLQFIGDLYVFNYTTT